MSDLRRLDMMRGYRVACRDLVGEPSVAPLDPGPEPEPVIEIWIEYADARRSTGHPRRTSRKPPLRAVRVAAALVRRKAP